jgi:methionyl-tRNA synthetase
MEEEDWFFRLSRYQEPLRRLVDGTEFVEPPSRRNEVRRMIDEIKDISVSRSLLSWGIPWPGDPEHSVYVWIDALTNYLSAAGFPEPGYERLWPANLHVIGKDIVRFHCVYWPAMLMSAGLATPHQVWAHGWMTMGGGKISKSEGVAFTLEEAIERHGPDALRYFILREVPWDGDGSFTRERFDERYTAELANDLGNLASRTLAMVQKYRGGVVPGGAPTELDAKIDEAVARYREKMDACLLHEGAAAAMSLVADANAFVGESAPWKLAKDPARAADLDAALTSLVRALAAAAVLLSPFMPAKMEELWGRLGAPDPLTAALDGLPALDAAGWTVSPGGVLFPRPELVAGG